MDKTEAVPVAGLKMRSIPTLPATMGLYDLLRLFQASISSSFFRHAIGVACRAQSQLGNVNL